MNQEQKRSTEPKRKAWGRGCRPNAGRRGPCRSSGGPRAAATLQLSIGKRTTKGLTLRIGADRHPVPVHAAGQGTMDLHVGTPCEHLIEAEKYRHQHQNHGNANQQIIGNRMQFHRKLSPIAMPPGYHGGTIRWLVSLSVVLSETSAYQSHIRLGNVRPAAHIHGKSLRVDADSRRPARRSVARHEFRWSSCAHFRALTSPCPPACRC